MKKESKHGQEIKMEVTKALVELDKEDLINLVTTRVPLYTKLPSEKWLEWGDLDGYQNWIWNHDYLVGLTIQGLYELYTSLKKSDAEYLKYINRLLNESD